MSIEEGLDWDLYKRQDCINMANLDITGLVLKLRNSGCILRFGCVLGLQL